MTDEDILDEVARRYFNLLSPNPDPAKGQWTYDEMPEDAKNDYKQSLRLIVDYSLELSRR